MVYVNSIQGIDTYQLGKSLQLLLKCMVVAYPDYSAESSQLLRTDRKKYIIGVKSDNFVEE